LLLAAVAVVLAMAAVAAQVVCCQVLDSRLMQIPSTQSQSVLVVLLVLLVIILYLFQIQLLAVATVTVLALGRARLEVLAAVVKDLMVLRMELVGLEHRVKDLQAVLVTH
jgi:hypothetical protein